MIFDLVVIALLAVQVGPATKSLDQWVDQYHAANGITPASICPDDRFLRRVTLDLAGRIPTIDELQQFRGNPDRSAKIDQLLASPEFPVFMSEVWTSSLVGYLNVFGTDREALRLWMEQNIRDDTPWNEMATALITAEGTSSLDGPVNFLVRNRVDPVVKVGRVFLGVRLDCAQCHDHPFDRWTQANYQDMRRFFSQIRNRQQDGSCFVYDEVRPTSPDQRPTFLTGSRPQTDHWRAELALFVTSSKPFARTFGNRVWYHLMGRGIVDPIDDFNPANPAVMPEVVEYLAEQARRDGFSLREMTRRICKSQTYQRDSSRQAGAASDTATFAIHSLKPLTPEQYIDSVVTALDLDLAATRRQQFVNAMVGDALQEDFNPTWEYRETVQKTLSRLAMQLNKQQFAVAEMYQRILTRNPTPRELLICENKSSEDVLFALIHSNEFFFNH